MGTHMTVNLPPEAGLLVLHLRVHPFRVLALRAGPDASRVLLLLAQGGFGRVFNFSVVSQAISSTLDVEAKKCGQESCIA